ncbi:MAG: type II toxin-antitoxin system RelE/ParE family toxin [Solirubrobacterales bacterium]|nr:type II toxin-antitoxin system RelE/ParE family toxin [Solirubrobacterales bacterium]
MAYRIEVRPAAARQLRKLDPPVARRIQGVITLLAEDPRPPAARPLTGRPGWRLRVGDWRVIYTIEDDRLIVVILSVAHRRDAYR